MSPVRFGRLHRVLLLLVVSASACGGNPGRSGAVGGDSAPGGGAAGAPRVGGLPPLVQEGCDSAAATWMRRIRTPQLRRSPDSLLPPGHALAGRRGCVVVVDGLQDGTTAGPEDLRAGLPGAEWRSLPGYDADGAGSTSFAIWRPGVLCVIHWEVPAGLDEAGRPITGDTEHVEVACVPATPGDAPDTAGRRAGGAG